MGELILIGFVLVIIFSASRMGKLGDALGKFVHAFKRASSGQDTIDVTPKKKLQGARGSEDAEVGESSSSRNKTRS